MKERLIAVTGAGGFIGTHVVNRLSVEPELSAKAVPGEAFESPAQLAAELRGAEAVIHLAGLNRAPDQELFDTNVALTKTLAGALQDRDDVHVLFASSIQRDQPNAYGRSKLCCEELLTEWATRSGAPLSLLVIPNVFGPGCRPHYNSVIATFAYELSRGGECRIDIDRELELIFIADLIETIYQILEAPPPGIARKAIGPTYHVKVSRALEILKNLSEQNCGATVPDLSDPLVVALFGTLQFFMDYSRLRQPLDVHEDERGRLMEYVRMASGGQVFFSTTLPGVVRGNHFHTRKLERFCVIEGRAIIRLRKLGTGQVVEYEVHGAVPEVINIPLFHTHNIENVGEGKLYTLFWSNEVHDPDDSDTFFEAV